MAEPDNEFDDRAIKVIDNETNTFIGYVPRDQTEPLHEMLAAGPVRGAVIFVSGDLKPLIEAVSPDAES
jgi:hypothetical protein